MDERAETGERERREREREADRQTTDRHTGREGETERERERERERARERERGREREGERGSNVTNLQIIPIQCVSHCVASEAASSQRHIPNQARCPRSCKSIF